MIRKYDYLIKILLLGDTTVGKSSLLLRFAEDTFTDSFTPTIWIDFRAKNIKLDDKTVRLQMWDRASQPKRSPAFTSANFRGVQGCIVVYDVTNRDSFDHVQEQFLEIDRYASNSVQRLLVGSKCDLVDKKVVDYPTSQEYADSIKVQLLETSAKCATNVEQAFVMMASKIMRHIDET